MYRFNAEMRTAAMVATFTTLAFFWLAINSSISAPPQQEDAEQVFALAANRYSLEDWERAAESFQTLLKDYPNSDRATISRFFLGECMIQMGRYGDARPHYQSFVDAQPNSEYLPQAVYRVGESAYLTSDHDGAAEWLERFLEDYPQHALAAYAHPYLADVYFERQDIKNARLHYIAALTEYPQAALVDHCRMGMARIFELEGKPEESLRFLELIADDNEGLAGDALYETLRLHREAGDSGKVRQTGRQYLERFSDGLYANAVRLLLAEAMQVDGNIDESFELIRTLDQGWDLEDQRVSEIAPGVLFRLAKARLDAGSADDADLLLKQIHNRWPESEWGDDALELLIRSAERQDLDGELHQLTIRFVEAYPRSELLPYVRELQGRCLYDDEAFVEAEAAFANAWELLRDREDATPDFKANLLYLHGLALVSLERYPFAIEQLKQAFPLLELAHQQADLTDSPTKLRSGLYLALASAYSKSKLHKAAATNRVAFLELETDTPTARDCAIDLVLDYLETNNLVEAEKWCSWLTERFPPSSEASSDRWAPLLQNTAESAFVDEEWTIAESVFQMLAKHAGEPEARAKGHSGLAWTKYKQEDFEAAATSFEAAVGETTTGEVAAECYYLLGRLAERNDDRAAANQWYSQIESADPTSKHVPDSLVRRARSLRKQDDQQSRQLSLELYERALNTNEQLVDVLLYEKAWLLLDLKQEDAGYAAFEQLVEGYRQSRFWCDAAYRVAERRTEQEKFEEADKLLREILARDDAETLRPFASYLLGQNAARRNAWHEVLSAMDTVVQLSEPHPLSSAAWYWKGEGHFRLDEQQEAEACFQRLTADSPNIDEAWLPTIQLRLAQLTALRGDWSTALQQATKIQDLKPMLAQPYELDYLLGRCLSSLGRFTEARKAYAEVIRSPIGARTETAAKSQWMIGESFFHQEKWDDAIDAFEKVEVLYGYPQWQAAAILQAGKCQEQAGRWKQAVKLYAKLLREHPKSEFVAEASERLKTTGQQNRTQR